MARRNEDNPGRPENAPTPPRDEHLPPPPFNPDANVAEDTRPYWIGCDLAGPLQVYHLGGMAFQHATFGTATGVPGSDPKLAKRQWRRGSVAHLTDAQVARIKAHAHEQVVRGYSTGPEVGKRDVLNARKRDYRRHKKDYPVGMHCWMIPFEQLSAGYEHTEPPRLIERVEDWKLPESYTDPEQQKQEEAAAIHARAMVRAQREMAASAT